MICHEKRDVLLFSGFVFFSLLTSAEDMNNSDPIATPNHLWDLQKLSQSAGAGRGDKVEKTVSLDLEINM